MSEVPLYVSLRIAYRRAAGLVTHGLLNLGRVFGVLPKITTL